MTMFKNNILKLITTLIFTLISVINSQSIPDVNQSYLGAGDTGVSYFPSYLGLKLHIRCYSNVTSANENGPVALFDSGMPFFSTAFVPIIPGVLQNMVAWNFSKACFMDRFGFGWSDAASRPISTQEYAFRLHESLEIAGLSGKKYVVVGWSWGSIFCQVFSLAYPREVVGMLTIDGSDSVWGFLPSIQQSISPYINDINSYITMNAMGTLRDACNQGLISMSYGYFPNKTYSDTFTECSVQASQDLWLNPSNKYLKSIIHETNSMVFSSVVLNFTHVINGPHSLRDLPYVNLYQTEFGPDWDNRQAIMASLSTNSVSYSFNNSHFFTWSNPGAIISGLNALALKIKTNPAVLFGRFYFPFILSDPTI